MTNEVMVYKQVIDDVKNIISLGLEKAYNSTNRVIVYTYWNIGKRIIE